MTLLDARVDVLERRLPRSLVGAGAPLGRRAFGVLTLRDRNGVVGLGEASPLPGYSPDSIEEAVAALRQLGEAPLEVDPRVPPRVLLEHFSKEWPLRSPSARCALESALLDWIGRVRGEPAHALLGASGVREIPIAHLVLQPDPSAWLAEVERLSHAGVAHIKLKIGEDFARELLFLKRIRDRYPTLQIRLDANRRLPIADLTAHATTLASLGVELIEEPVRVEHWPEALSLPIPFALDETLRNPEVATRLLAQGRVRAVVLKPMVLGGFAVAFDLAERAREHGAHPLVSHVFDGSIARAAAAELALALGTRLAAGLGDHPALEVGPSYRAASLDGARIRPHRRPGLGLERMEAQDA